MKTRTLIVTAIVLMAAVQIACAASANVGAPTPQPTSEPRVIVVQQPAPAQRDDGTLIVIAVIVLAGTMMVSGAVIGYIARGKPQRQSAVDPQSLTLTTNNYYGVQPPTPAQLTEAEQFRILRNMGHTPESAWNLIATGQTRQIGAPKQ